MTAILYTSRYGASREYALMLRDWTGAVVIENERLTPALVAEFGTLLAVGGVYMGKIDGLGFFRDYATDLRKKHRLAVLAVGIAPEDKGYYARLYADNFRHHLKGIPLFYARGRLEMEALSRIDKGLMKTFVRFLKGRTELSAFSKEIAEGTSLDYMSEDYLDEVKAYLMAGSP